MEFEKQLEEWMKLDYVLPEDLPPVADVKPRPTLSERLTMTMLR